MRKLFMPVMLAGSLALGGCAAGLGGGNPLGSILGSVLGGAGGGGYGGGGYGSGGNYQAFQNAAVNACGQYASRYGRVSIQDVRQASSSSLRVYGLIDVNGGYQRRQFQCSFRSDGRVTDFDLN